MENITSKEFEENLQLAKNSKQELDITLEGAKASCSAFERLQNLQSALTEVRNVLDVKNTESPVAPALDQLVTLLNNTDIPRKYELLTVKLDDVRTMLGHVLNFNGTRIALCATIDRVFPTLSEAIKAEEVYKEAQEMRSIIWSFFKLSDEELSRFYRVLKKD